MTELEFGERCREIIEADDFPVTEPFDFDPWISSVVLGFLARHDIKWKASRPVGPGVVIKIDDKYLRFLLVMPKGSYDGQSRDQFYWMIGTDPNNDDHSVHPDVASAYLLRKEFPGTEVTEIRGDDGTAITKLKMPGAQPVVIVWPKGMFGDK